jgi:hypothetical protein
MHVERHPVTVTTDASGDGTGYTARPVTGRILHVIYTKNNYDNGVDFAVTGEDSGIAIWTGTDVNASTTVSPRAATHSTAGAAALYAAGGTAVNDHVYVANERIKVVVAQGGNVKSGTVTFIIG